MKSFLENLSLYFGRFFLCFVSEKRLEKYLTKEIKQINGLIIFTNKFRSLNKSNNFHFCTFKTSDYLNPKN